MRCQFSSARRSVAQLSALFILSASIAVSAAPASSTPAAKVAAPPAPQLNLLVAPRTLTLQWTRAPSARSYRVYVQRSPGSRWTMVGAPLAASKYEQRLALSAHLAAWEARYLVEACNQAGCSRSAPATAAAQSANAVEVLAPGYELHEPTSGSRVQQFGRQAAVSGGGRTLAIADVWYFGGSEWPWCGSGAVYVYRRTATSWTLQAKLEPPAARGYDFFGSDLELSADGDTLAIGAQNEGYDAPSQDAGPGAVFVFTRRSGVWSQQALLRAANAQDGASFGRNVELNANGDVIAAGAPYERAGELAAAGAVYLFNRNPAGAWSLHATLTAPAPEHNDLFGYGVRLSADGRTAAVLAAEQNYATEDAQNGGWSSRYNTLYIFGLSAGVWSLQAEFEGSAVESMLGGTSYEPEGQAEGFDLGGLGRTLAIASPYAAAVDGGVGVIRIYRRTNDVWRLAGELFGAADRSMLGLRLTLSSDGDVLAATSRREDGVYGRPYVLTFANANGVWTQRAALESPVYPSYSSFGDSIALSSTGKRLVIGAGAYTTAQSWWGAALVY